MRVGDPVYIVAGVHRGRRGVVMWLRQEASLHWQREIGVELPGVPDIVAFPASYLRPDLEVRSDGTGDNASDG